MFQRSSLNNYYTFVLLRVNTTLEAWRDTGTLKWGTLRFPGSTRLVVPIRVRCVDGILGSMLSFFVRGTGCGCAGIPTALVV